jgi:MSHA pilin protein MshD
MKTAEQNYRLLQEIEANRRFLIMACQQNPELLERADVRIRKLFEKPMRHDPLFPQTLTRSGKQRGISLIELIMFIVIISIAVAGILLVMNQVTGHSADALVRKQSLAIAESLLEEIELQAMSGVTPNLAPAPNWDRRSFDNVCNYNGYNTTGGMKSMDGTTTLPGLGSYNVAPAVVVDCTTSPWAGIPAGSAVVITVSVTGPGGQIDLTGYRAGN